MRVLMVSIDAAFGDTAGAFDAARARRVGALAGALAGAGADVAVVAGVTAGRAAEGVRLVPGVDHPPLVGRDDLLAATLHLSNGMLEAAVATLRATPAQLIHAHDWPSAWTASALKATFGIPVVSTLHGARAALGEGPGGDVARQASWWLTYESRRTIVHDRGVRARLEDAFTLPPGKQDVIGPGRGSWAAVAERTLACYRRAISEEESSLWRGDHRDVAHLRALWGGARRAR